MEYFKILIILGGLTLFKVGNSVCLIYSSDDPVLKWHYYILPLTIISLFCKYFSI